MDRRLDARSRWNRDRRADSGARLVAFLSRHGMATFDDLLGEAEGDVGDVSSWLAHAKETGLVDEVGPEAAGGTRHYVLRRDRAQERWRRRSEDRS